MVRTELAEQFKALPNDVEKWKWILERKDTVHIECDNDWTGAYFDGDESEDPITLEFDGYVGWSGGIFSLFEAVGINASSV